MFTVTSSICQKLFQILIQEIPTCLDQKCEARNIIIYGMTNYLNLYFII